MPTFGDYEEEEIAREILKFYMNFMLSSIRRTRDLELQKDTARWEKLERQISAQCNEHYNE